MGERRTGSFLQKYPPRSRNSLSHTQRTATCSCARSQPPPFPPLLSALPKRRVERRGGFAAFHLVLAGSRGKPGRCRSECVVRGATWPPAEGVPAFLCLTAVVGSAVALTLKLSRLLTGKLFKCSPALSLSPPPFPWFGTSEGSLLSVGRRTFHLPLRGGLVLEEFCVAASP